MTGVSVTGFTGWAAVTCTAAPNDCSLRGAVTFANLNPGTTIIVPAGTYQLNIPGGAVEGFSGNNLIGDPSQLLAPGGDPPVAAARVGRAAPPHDMTEPPPDEPPPMAGSEAPDPRALLRA